MDEKKLKNAVHFDSGVVSFSEDIFIERVFVSDGLTFVNLVIYENTRVSFTIDGVNPKIVFKTLFGALHGFSLHSCIPEMVKFLHDLYHVKRITIDFDYEKD